MKFNKDVKEKLLFHVTINVIVIRNMIERLKVGDIMGKIIAIANQKGGVGKTTTSVNLGAGLAQVGKKVLLVDIDAQGNATTGVGIEKSELDQCIYNVLVEDADVQGVIQKTATENLDVLPATIQLAGAEIELVPTISREVRLQRALQPVRNEYDYIIIDCPPSLGLLTINALTAADSVIIPVQCEYYALEGLSQLLNTVRLVQKHLNKNLAIQGVLLTMLDARTNLGIQVIDEVKKYFRDKVYRSIIPRNVRLSEAPSHGKPIMQYDAKSRGAEVYIDLAEEVIAGG
ncbi:chromosome segregation ATPase [Bacillus thuringiensis str. Al Hakam]|nr:chromosome segregation ATPase [Bacillus thuringiensis str. Al Hakam]